MEGAEPEGRATPSIKPPPAARDRPCADLQRHVRLAVDAKRGLQSRWLPARLIPHRHRPRAELQPTHELQVDTFR
jgi:hypothetical protein